MKERTKDYKKPQKQRQGGDLLTDILTFPVLGIPRMMHWISKKIAEVAEEDEMDEGKLQGDLLELQMRYELGEINDEEYAEQETAILDKLNSIRRAKEED